MSDIHVLAGDGDSCNVILHFAVPNVNNTVGVNYRTALVNSGLGGTTQMVVGTGPGQIATAEKESIEAGAVCEHAMSFGLEGNGDSAAAVQAELRKQCVRERSLAIAKLQNQLKYFGHTESET